MKNIYDKANNILVSIVRKDSWSKGLDFITDDQQYLQVGTWWYDAGQKLDRHYHNILKRESDLTQECVVIIQGSMRVDIYDRSTHFVESFELNVGDFAVFFDGGHEYEILEDDTRIIETKNGPFMGVDLDKTRF